MNGEPSQYDRLLWLPCAFIPSVAGIACLGAHSPPQWMFTALVILNGGCCLLAAFGLLGGIKELIARVFLGLFLAGFLFVLNCLIVLFVGCSGMGRIAP